MSMVATDVLILRGDDNLPPHWTERFREVVPRRWLPGQLPKMNATVKAWWLEKLRSGDFKQGKQSLKTADSATNEVTHCCLGVLCEAALKVGVLDREEKQAHGGFRFILRDPTDSYDLRYGTMPGLAVLEWADLIQGFDGYLASANDKGATFEEIAAFVEAEL